MCLYLFIGSPFALDVDTGVATVTSGRGKGKYGEDLQLGHNEDVSWLTDWPAQTSLPLVAQTSVRKCFLTHQIDWCSKKYDKQYDNTIKQSLAGARRLYSVFVKLKVNESSDSKQLTVRRFYCTRTRAVLETL